MKGPGERFARGGGGSTRSDGIGGVGRGPKVTGAVGGTGEMNETTMLEDAI